MRYCLGLEYHRKGYNNSEDLTNWTTVVGVHTESTVSSVEAAAGYQIDPEGFSGVFRRAILRDCTGRPNVDTEKTANGAKFAVVQDVYLTGCQFIHTEPEVTTLRFAETVGRVRVDSCFFSRRVFIEHIWSTPPQEMRFERTIIGDGTHDPNYALEQTRCKILRISDSVLTGYKFGGIEWRSTDATYTLIAATNCDFNGKRISDTTYDISKELGNPGQLNKSRKLKWLGNRRDNTASGGTEEFTDPVFSSNILGTTRDASMAAMEHSAAPTGSLVTWAVGDIVANSSPTSGGYYGWVCTTATPAPGTWKQWGLIS